VTWTATHDAIRLSWEAPEYTDGLNGFEVTVSYQYEGNGDEFFPSWDVSELIFLGRSQVSSLSSSISIGCTLDGAELSVCLSAYTIYYVEIIGLRENGADEPQIFYISTAKLEKSSYDHSEVYIYSGDVFVRYLEPIGWFSNSTVAIGASPFAGARIESPSRDLVVELNDSSVTSVSLNEFRILMSHSEYASINTQISRPEFTFTSMSLVYADGQKSLPLYEFCL
jgi:hypothetical protein